MQEIDAVRLKRIDLSDDYDHAQEGEITPNDLLALRTLACWLTGSPGGNVSV
jgi:hypothetical protein